MMTTPDDSKKDAIADMFFAQFLKNGMVKTIINDVANEMHISKKTIYKYFKGGKEECLYYIYYKKAELLRQDVEKAIAQIVSPSKKMACLLEMVYREVIPHVLRNAAKTEMDYIIENQIVSNAYRDVFNSLFLEIVELGNKTQEFNVNNPQFTVSIIYAIISQSMIMIRNDPNIQIEHELMESIQKLLA